MNEEFTWIKPGEKVKSFCEFEKALLSRNLELAKSYLKSNEITPSACMSVLENLLRKQVFKIDNSFDRETEEIIKFLTSIMYPDCETYFNYEKIKYGNVDICIKLKGDLDFKFEVKF